MMSPSHSAASEFTPAVPPAAPPLTGRAPPRHLRIVSAPDFDDIVDEWGAQSFPASDPPANW